MANDNAWDLLREGNVEQGIILMRDSYMREPTPSHTMRGVGVGYLWIADYQAAWKHFQHAIETYPDSLSGFYGMAGTAKWCVDEYDVAVRCWDAGLSARFADAAGGVHLPLLLFVGAVLKPAVFSRKKAKEILSAKIKDPRAKNWPGPLAPLVLDLIDENALTEVLVESGKRDLSYRKRLVKFYKGVLDLQRGTLPQSGFKKLMAKTADTSQEDCSDQKDLLHLLWSEEFFIARHESVN
jgi:hypothetical protein